MSYHAPLPPFRRRSRAKKRNCRARWVYDLHIASVMHVIFVCMYSVHVVGRIYLRDTDDAWLT